MSKPLIAVLGANPSWQKTLFFDALNPGKVNRAVAEENYPSGKGVNFCRALRCSNLADMCLFQFAGGINGQRLCDGLDQTGFPHVTIKTAAETRSCITCLDNRGNMTELIGASYPVSPAESSAMLDALNTSLPRTGILAITGSLPDNSDPELFVNAVKAATQAGIPVLIDALVALEKILSTPGKIILKVNREEFSRITGEKDLLRAHRTAGKKFPGKIFAITDGADTATISDGKTLTRFTLPEIKVVSPLGAGDTASAVMSALVALGENAEEAFRLALAAASANCENAIAGEYSPQRAAELAGQISASRILLEI